MRRPHLRRDAPTPPIRRQPITILQHQGTFKGSHEGERHVSLARTSREFHDTPEDKFVKHLQYQQRVGCHR